MRALLVDSIYHKCVFAAGLWIFRDNYSSLFLLDLLSLSLSYPQPHHTPTTTTLPLPPTVPLPLPIVLTPPPSPSPTFPPALLFARTRPICVFVCGCHQAGFCCLALSGRGSLSLPVLLLPTIPSTYTPQLRHQSSSCSPDGG